MSRAVTRSAEDAAVNAEGAEAGALMINEDITNGIWTQLLCEAFTFTEGYLIIPEYTFDYTQVDETTKVSTTTKHFADLAVVKIDGRGVGVHQLIVLFEGKKAGGGAAKLEGMLTQAMKALKGKKSGETPLIIGAKGNKFFFCFYNGTSVPGFKTDSTDTVTADIKDPNQFKIIKKQLKKWAAGAGAILD